MLMPEHWRVPVPPVPTRRRTGHMDTTTKLDPLGFMEAYCDNYIVTAYDPRDPDRLTGLDPVTLPSRAIHEPHSTQRLIDRVTLSGNNYFAGGMIANAHQLHVHNPAQPPYGGRLFVVSHRSMGSNPAIQRVYGVWYVCPYLRPQPPVLLPTYPRTTNGPQQPGQGVYDPTRTRPGVGIGDPLTIQRFRLEFRNLLDAQAFARTAARVLFPNDKHTPAHHDTTTDGAHHNV